MRSPPGGKPPLRLRVQGVPVAQGRPRAGFRRGTKSIIMYDPEKSKSWKAYVGAKLREYLAELGLEVPAFPEGPLVVCVTSIFPGPKNAPVALRRHLQPRAVRPDADNCLKLCTDAANGILWTDDAQIASATCITLNTYHGEPQTVIDVREWRNSDAKEDILK